MNDIEKRVKILEEKVHYLEKTLDTLKNMQLSEQMSSYIKSRTKTLKLVDLLNELDNEKIIDLDKEAIELQNIIDHKATLENQILIAIRSEDNFKEQAVSNPENFDYEMENGVTQSRLRREYDDIQSYRNKGIRIISYNGFNSEKIVIPNEIDGYPVISIGDKAFMNTNVSEVILPDTLKIILNQAFYGCINLKKIELPDTMFFLGEECFENSGLETVILPSSLYEIPPLCFADCKSLQKVKLGNNIQNIGTLAFKGCTKLNKILLPNSVKKLHYHCFSQTMIKTLVIPCNVEELDDVFERRAKRVTLVFLGKETSVNGSGLHSYVELIYCLPGSKVQKIGREYNIDMKQLSEFKINEI